MQLCARFFLFIIALLSCQLVLAEEKIIKILGVNDFHGQISTGRILNNMPIGGAAILAAYLKNGQSELDKNTIVAFSGDLVGASPPASGLLNHEPSMLFFNSLGNSFCDTENRMNAKCNLVAAIGNHEFDRGIPTLLELIYGANKPPIDNWIPIPVYPGSTFPFISANTIDATTQKPIFPPYVIKEVNGVKIGFIGAILKGAPQVILPDRIQNVEFIDEAKAINQYIPEMKKKGADFIVVLIHQGGEQKSYEGETQEDSETKGDIVSIVKELDDSVELVLAGHTHSFINAFLPNKNGKKILVTEANCYSAAFAENTITFDTETHKVIKKSAKIIDTYADKVPGGQPDLKALILVGLAEKSIAPTVNQVIGTLTIDLDKKGNAAGESTLGNLLADAYKNLKADFGIVNPGGIRAPLKAGPVTWGHAYAVQPFGNEAGIVKLKGQDIYDLLEQQWRTDKITILQVSGLNYTYNPNNPIGKRVITIFKDNVPLDKSKVYTIATSEFIAGGGDGFTVMRRGTFNAVGKVELDVFIEHIKRLPQPFSAEIEGRIVSL